jgi:nucleoid-associated protein YgaU
MACGWGPAVYGDGERWRDIAALNLIRRPEQLRVGQVIRLP